MTTPVRSARAPSKQAKKAALASGAGRAKTAARTKARRAATNLAITTELAPAVAIALLDKTEQPAGALAPALDCLAAGATASKTEGKVRVQLMFENGTVLPVEMSSDAGAALVKGLKEELPKS